MNALADGWLVVNALTLFLVVAVLGGWARTQPRVYRHALAAVVCVIIAALALGILFEPDRLAIGWVTVLMEGRSIRNIQQLYGEGAHFGPGFHAFGEWLSSHDANTLRAVVHANASLALVNALLFFFVASYVLRSRWAALAFAVFYACNLNSVHAALSETPAVLWATYFWLGCAVAAVIDDETTTSPLRPLALLALGLLTGLAAALRIELLALGAPALGFGLAKTLGREPAVRRMAERLKSSLRSLLAGPLSTFVIVTAGLGTLELVPWPGNMVGWLAAGLRPLNLSFLTLPQTLAVFLPFGLVVLFVLGVIHTTRHWFSFLLLPISTLALFKVYSSAAHGVFFERFRYLTFLTPVVLFIALFGFRELSDWSRRWNWPSWWRRAAGALLLMSFAVWQPPGPKEIFRRRQNLPGLTQSDFLLAWNQQTEVRYLLDLVARYPRCVFLAKTANASWAPDTRTGERWALFGRPLDRYLETDTAGSPEEIAERLVPEAPCVLLYRSLDCNLVTFDGCQVEAVGRTALEERVLENLPYSDITEYGAHQAEIRLAVYPVSSRAPGAEQRD